MRKILRLITALIGLVYIFAFALICLSGPMTEDGRGTTLIGTPKVFFANGGYSVESTDIALVLQPGETELLSQLPLLKTADFSGSTCYGEIIDWTKKNPQVDVKYTVTLPVGSTVDNSVTELDFSGIDSGTLNETVEYLAYLPHLSSIELGQADDSNSLSSEDLAALRAACPEAELSYSFFLLGSPIDMRAESVDLRGISGEDVTEAAAVLSCIPSITYVNLGDATTGEAVLSWDDIAAISAACPNAELDYTFSLYGQTLDFKAESLDFNHIEMSDGGAAVRQVLPYMKKCTYLDMDSCGVSNEDMEAIRNDFPNIKVIWRIWFGENYSVRTDVERIYASKPSVGGPLYDHSVEVFKYCTDVKYLDIGHNVDVGDLSFASYMPNLEVLIISMTNITDLSPLSSCSKLEYLEFTSTHVSDLSPLSGLTSLHHLNIASCESLSDISPLYSLTELERLWIGCITPVPAEQVQEMQAAVPNCEINTVAYDPHDKWRYTAYDPNIPKYYWVPRYELLRNQLGYNYQEYSFYWLDEKCGIPAPPEHAGKYGKMD